MQAEIERVLDANYNPLDYSFDEFTFAHSFAFYQRSSHFYLFTFSKGDECKVSLI